MLNAILQLKLQGEGRESAIEALLMVGYTSNGLSIEYHIKSEQDDCHGAPTGS